MILTKRILTLIFLIITGTSILSCSNSKNNKGLEYEDYDPEEFYEVIGRVKENRLSYHIPKTNILFYEYFLGKEKPLEGYEKNIKARLKEGEKFIVLVHKKDSTISFFGYVDPRFRKESFEKARKKANKTFTKN
ncbi:hypothetical protein [uncultured Christiangramia sp.]|uniref:hypothetical protein n=1 Tax=uncultured Christiangramia sp. TaxID=503836 RepID=UPI00262EB286|nr:hypothetical protein [uncultured Christiangramia sp.]